jgi:hypothetical protein
MLTAADTQCRSRSVVPGTFAGKLRESLLTARHCAVAGENHDGPHPHQRAETRCRRVTPLEPPMNAFHTIVAAAAPAPMRNARRAVKTSGIVTKGTCAKICTHHRNPSVGNLPVARGMAASDITSQMRGP